jgi:serine/threonine protein kinase
MAPEQWLNDGVTAAVDVYALGVTMIELLTGKPAERLPLRADKFTAGRDKQIQALRDPRWGGVWWRRLEELLQDMLALDALDRPSADRVQEVCLELSEDIGGASLRRYARQAVPSLVAARRARMKSSSLLPSADLIMTAPQDPSLLTGSKSIPLEGSDQLPPLMGSGWWLQVGLAAALAWSLWWFLSA